MTRHFAFCLCLFAALPAIAQESDPFAPAQGLAEGWEEIDQRLIFLMVRLVDVEANLEAIDKAMGKNKARAGMATGQARRAEAGNERMDRRAGGPVRWDKFYGTTAEKFFYHPTDNHTYHTKTILSHQSPGRDNQTEPGVPSRQGLPVHQRPPQFDYMYRANETARQRAESNVAKFRGNAAKLAARRHELELEQGKLWCEVAFRAVARNDLDRKPLYTYAPQGDGKEGLLAATKFVVTALSIVTNGQKDQAGTFRQIKPLIRKARYELGKQWTQAGVKFRNSQSDEWKFASLARRLEDVSANLGDSYTVSVERESAGDADRRDLYRGLLQKALLQYAETVLALDEMASEMAKASGFEADLNKPLATPTLAAMPTLATSESVNASSPFNPTPDPQWQQLVGMYRSSDGAVWELGMERDGAPRIRRAKGTWSRAWKKSGDAWLFDVGNVDIFAVELDSQNALRLSVFWRANQKGFSNANVSGKKPDRSFRFTKSSQPTNEWIALFDGTSLDMWTTDEAKKVALRNEVLLLGQGGILKTKDRFANFVLMLEYRFPFRGNIKPGGGVLPRMQSKHFIDNVEVQLAPGATGDFWVGDDSNTMSLLQTDRRRIDASKPRRRHRMNNVSERANDWNTMEIDCNGDRIKVSLNGKLANEGWRAVSRTGPIGLMAQDVDIEFRNIRAKNQ